MKAIFREFPRLAHKAVAWAKKDKPIRFLRSDNTGALIEELNKTNSGLFFISYPHNPWPHWWNQRLRRTGLFIRPMWVSPSFPEIQYRTFGSNSRLRQEWHLFLFVLVFNFFNCFINCIAYVLNSRRLLFWCHYFILSGHSFSNYILTQSLFMA